MQSEFRAALVSLCRRVLHPLVRILLRFGVSAGELKSIVDSVYAHAASEYLDGLGERVTISRLAVITGMNRSALPLILATPQDEFSPRSNTQLHRASRVLTGWHDDVDFQTRSGEPAVLPIRGGRRSFQELVHRYSGGLYFRTVLAELVAAGAVERAGTGSVRAVRRSVTSAGGSPEAIFSAGQLVGELMGTLERNLDARPHEQLPVRIHTLPIDPRSLPLFRSQVGRRADALIEQIDSFLQAHRSPKGRLRPATRAATDDLTVGAAVFAVCREPERAHGTAEMPHRKGRERRTKR
ncbi:MAG TPA: DUF6502 family protein [Steroidobacteraceae bacterium]|nr:DUF6502 family protein [Steroidobacteraceae bacterium]